MKSLKIALCGFYAKHNFGDDLMADQLSDILSQNGKHEVFVYSDVSNRNVLNGLTTKDHLKCDVIVIGGGGIISKSFWAFKNDGLKKIKESGKPVVFLNVNVTLNLIQEIAFVEELKSLNAIWWVRNKQSLGVLGKVGIEANYLPDVSFKKGVVPLREKTEKRQLAVFLNSYVFHELTGAKDTKSWLKAHFVIKELCTFLDWMTAFGWEVKFLAAHTGRDVDDRIPGAFAFQTLKKKSAASWAANPMTWQELVDEISKSELVLSMRFHASTVALAAGVPLIDITHHDKNKQLLRELDLTSLSVNYHELTETGLKACAQTAENTAAYRSRLSFFRAESHERWEKFDSEWDSFLKEFIEHATKEPM